MIHVYDFEDTLIIRIPKEDKKAFRVAIARACNVWPDAPVEIKELHDLVIHGRPLQDYASQPVFTKREELPPEVNQLLDRPSVSKTDSKTTKKVEPFETENKEPGT